MPESRDDTRDDLSILMPADQHVGSWPTIACRNHQLLRMPKREDDMPSLTIQRIHLLVPLRIHPHRPPQPSNYRSPDWREHRKLQPCPDSLLHAFSSSHSSPMKLPAANCGVSCEILRPVGQSLWAACRSRYPPSPRLRRVLLAFIPATAYSAEVVTSATKAGSCGVCGEGESHITIILCIGNILELHGVEPLVLSATAKQLVVRPHFDDRPSGQHHDSIGLLNR